MYGNAKFFLILNLFCLELESFLHNKNKRKSFAFNENASLENENKDNYQMKVCII